jgi:hypothetical protein
MGRDPSDEAAVTWMPTDESPDLDDHWVGGCTGAGNSTHCVSWVCGFHESRESGEQRDGADEMGGTP